MSVLTSVAPARIVAATRTAARGTLNPVGVAATEVSGRPFTTSKTEHGVDGDVVVAVIGGGVVGAGLRTILSEAGLHVGDVGAADVVVIGVAPDAVDRATSVVRQWHRPVVAVLTEPDREAAMALVGARVSGCGVMSGADSWLAEAVRSAKSAGSVTFDATVAAWLADRLTMASAPSGELSEREAEVLALVAEGLANKQIARRLGIAERTVKAHLTRVFSQIGVATRTEAALWWNRRAEGDREGVGQPRSRPSLSSAARNASRQRLRVGPTLPTGIPSREAAAS